MRTLTAALLLALAAGCATVPGPPNPRDPWEGYNRGMYAFNDGVDKAVLKPVAQGYQKVVPGFMQEGVQNFFGNLADLGIGLNNILQGKVVDGLSDIGRFGVNTVMGVAGLWDVASPMGLDKHNEDFGQTLGRWGVPPGPYLVLPLFGPSTLRDAPARYVDPQFFQGRWIDSTGWTYSLFVLDITRTRAGLLKAGDILDEAALDRYTFTRDAWLQRRRHLVYDGRPPKDLDDE